MPEIEDRLLPRDGLNTYNVFLARMDLAAQGSAQFTFAVTQSMMPLCELTVGVPFQGQSLDRMAVDAHDGLVDILRQLIFRADKARASHLKQAERILPPPAFLTAEEDFPAPPDEIAEETSL